jgi:urease accessory protein
MMSQFDVFGNVIVLTPKRHADGIARQVPATMNLPEQWAAGASKLPNDAGLIYKVVGMETAVVRARIREFWAIVREEVVGARVPREFAWR